MVPLANQLVKKTNYKLKIPDAKNLVGLRSIHRLVPSKNLLRTIHVALLAPPPIIPLSMRYIHSLSRSQKSLYVYRYILHTTTTVSLSHNYDNESIN